MEWGVNLFRSLFAAIDSVIYTLIAIVYEIVIQISKINIFGDGAIKEVAEKFYTLLGIFMLFKVTFSFITYLVNPDQLTEKGKGAQKVILNILLVLAMIMITPFAFDKLYEAQDAILKDNVLPKLILGQDDESVGSRAYLMSDVCPNTNVAATDGDYLSLMVFRPFYQIDESVSNSTKNAYCAAGETMSVSKYLNLSTPDPGSNFIQTLITVANPALGNIFPSGGSSSYSIDYKIFASTLVGVVVLLVLISFCFDIAVRSIKIGFLQIIAPIPIISYVDPKSGKDGMFKKWIREVGKTWLDLFVRLAALYFAIYVIKLLDLVKLYEGIEKYKFWVALFFVIGALIFAKKLPKLIEEILGIKLGGELTLNPMKKIRNNALGGKAVTGALKGTAALGVGAAAGIAANGAALATNIRNDGLRKALMGDSTGIKGAMRATGNIVGVLGGGASAGLHGALGSLKNDSFKKGVKGGLKASVDNRDKRDKREEVGYDAGTRFMDTLKGYAGIKTEAKKRQIQLGDEISAHQATQAGLIDQWKGILPKLTPNQSNQISSVSVSKDKAGNTFYSFKGKDNKILEWNNQTRFSEADLSGLIDSGSLGGKFEDIYRDEDIYEDQIVTNIVDGEERRSIQKVKTGTRKVLVQSGKDIAMAAINTQIAMKSENKAIADLQKAQAIYQKEEAEKKK